MENQSDISNPSDAVEGAGIDLDEATNVDRQRILVVDDDPDTILLLKQVLRLGGFDVLSASGGQEALKKTADYNPDLMLLDLMMPDMDGFETFSYLQKLARIPVIIISAKGLKEEIVQGLQLGVDDYIPKPFNNAELVARVRTVLRRAGRPQQISRLVFPLVGLFLDLTSQEVTLANRKISLTSKEFAVLSTLAREAPSVVTYPIICQTIWGADSDEARKRTKYLVYLIRRKFDQVESGKKLILNVDRLGYKLQTT